MKKKRLQKICCYI